jgi:hypothetical protein
VLAAVLDGDHLGAFPDVQPGHALGPVNLVGRERQHVDVEGVEIDGRLPEGLHRVHVERDPVLAGDRPDLPRGLDGPDLGVGVHDRDQDGLGPDGPPDRLGIHEAVPVHVQVGGLEPQGLEVLHRPQHRVVLDLRRDEVAATAPHRHALDRHVVGLGAARGEHDLLLAHPEEVRHLLARGLEPLARLPAEAVHARRIAEVLAEVRQHRGNHLGMYRGGGVVIEIDLPVH